MTAPRTVRQTLLRTDPHCREDGCPETAFGRGLCRLHYIMARYQDLLA